MSYSHAQHARSLLEATPTGCSISCSACGTALQPESGTDDTVTGDSAATHRYLTMSMLQLLSKTAAMWYLGGEAAHVQQLQTQDTRIASVPAVHFPDAVWHERYKARPSAAATPDAMQPSALWIGRGFVVDWQSLRMHLGFFEAGVYQ